MQDPDSPYATEAQQRIFALKKRIQPVAPSKPDPEKPQPEKPQPDKPEAK
jgi:hypothetical protein